MENHRVAKLLAALSSTWDQLQLKLLQARPLPWRSIQSSSNTSLWPIQGPGQGPKPICHWLESQSLLFCVSMEPSRFHQMRPPASRVPGLTTTGPPTHPARRQRWCQLGHQSQVAHGSIPEPRPWQGDKTGQLALRPYLSFYYSLLFLTFVHLSPE